MGDVGRVHHGLIFAGLQSAALIGCVVLAVVVLDLALGRAGGRIATLFCVNLCAVLAFQIFSGNSGVISFGHTAFMGVGAYVSAWMTMPEAMLARTLPSLPPLLGGYELPLIGSLVVVALVGAAMALVSGLAIARLGGASGAIATLGLLVIVYTVLAAATDFTRGNQAFYGVPRWTDATVATTFACLFILVARLFRESRSGLMLRAARDDEPAAIASGVDPTAMRLRAWLLSGVLAAVAGALYGHMLGAFVPRDFYFSMAFGFVAMMIVGGLTTVTGAVGGVALVMLLREGLQRLENGFSVGPVTVPEISGLPVLGVSVTILLVLYFRPDGLFGVRELVLPRRAAAAPSPKQPASGPPDPSARPLRLAGVGKSFAGLIAVKDVSAEIPPRAITGLIGPNGAGKSTLVNLMTGFETLSTGEIHLGEERLDGRSAQSTARAGIARTFQHPRLFQGLTVEENVMVAAIARGATLDHARAVAASELDRIGLGGVGDHDARSLAYGSRRRLEIARALAARPAFLLLDEPAAGMNPEETADLARRLRALPTDRGIGVLLIDHDLPFVTSLCERIIVLNRGIKIAEDAPAALMRDPAVIEAYIGARASRAAETQTTEAGTHHRKEENNDVAS